MLNITADNLKPQQPASTTPLHPISHHSVLGAIVEGRPTDSSELSAESEEYTSWDNWRGMRKGLISQWIIRMALNGYVC